MRPHVKSFGPLNAKIAIVGEAPGEQEEREGRPFVGPSGNLLRVVMADSGLDLSSCRLLNVSEVRPSKDFHSEFYDQKGNPKDSFFQSVNRLKEELRVLRPNLIVLLGKHALYALTGKTSIEAWRGIIHSTECGKAIATYHPAAVLRDYDLRPIMQIDLNRCAKEFLSPDFTPEIFHMKIAPTFAEVMEFFDEVREKIDRFVSFDTETLGRLIRCLGFSVDGKSAMCIPFMKVERRTLQSSRLVSPHLENSSYWTLLEEKEITRRMNEFFADSKIRFIAQNFPFDVTLLEENFKTRIANFYLDTLAAHHACYIELPKDLDFLTSVYTRIPHYSDYDSKSDQSTWIYNCYDCIATHQVATEILKELKKFSLENFYFHHVHPLIGALTRAQNYGVLIDVENREELAKPFIEELEILQKKQEMRFGKSINLASPKQVMETIKSLKYPTPRDKYGKDSTNARALESLKNRFPNEPFFKDVLDFRGKQKFLTTYVQASLDDDNRFRTSYNASGTITGRISSSQTLWKTGGNLQNIPKRGDDERKATFRRLFIAPKGWKILHADLSQAEARVVVWLSRDSELIQRYSADPHFDIHTYVASELYGAPTESITKEQRQKAKACVHSGNYAIGPRTFSYISGISYKEALPLLRAYQGRSALQQWWRSVREQLSVNRTLWTPLGRMRQFFGRLDDATYRQAYGFVPQSTVGDVVNRAFYILDSLIDFEKAHLILQVHDEIDLEVRDDYVEEALKLLRQALHCPLKIHSDLPELLIPADYGLGQNWYDLEELLH